MINNLANNNAQPKIKIEKAKEKDEGAVNFIKVDYLRIYITITI